jgi:hypothetical protein
VIAFPCLLYSVDLTVLNLAVPSLSADLALRDLFKQGGDHANVRGDG